MTTSLYVQFDPRHDDSHGENGVRYDQSDCLNCGSSESLSPEHSPLDGVDMDDNSYVVSEGGGYAIAPILHGKDNNNNNNNNNNIDLNKNSDNNKPSAAYASFDSTSDDGNANSGNNYAQAPTSGNNNNNKAAATTMRSASSAASTSSQQLSTGQREWNSEHQSLAKSPQWYRFYPHLAALTQQFQETAFTYGRLIISERALPPEQRSIKPINIGGVAGGDKYVHNGILFKFATDPVVAQHKGKPIYLFGGSQPNDEKAIKAMSREMLGADRYWGTFQDLLHYPLMCLIDFKGFRMLAMAVLPISHDTIVYGSDDGGRTVHTDDEKVNAVMKLVGERLNLKGHYVGLNEQHFIYGAGDVEVHRGTDGRYYVVDFARCSAPEAPPESGDRRTVFSKLLRPEFTRAYKKPLCADAFSRWDASREDALQHARDVVEATQYLYDVVVPNVARRIANEVAALNVSFDIGDQLRAAGGYSRKAYVFDPDHPLLEVTDAPPSVEHTVRVDELDDDLEACVSSAQRPMGRRVSRLVSEQLDMLGDIISSHRLHKEGINMRHLGRVRAVTECVTSRVLILSVCVARVLKMQLNERMREKMRSLSLPADMPFKAVACQFLAMVMRGFAGDQHFDTKQARYFWRDELKRELNVRFEHCLNETERAEAFDLRQIVSYKLVYSVFLRLTGMQIDEKALTHLWKSETTSFAINAYDILDVGSTWQATQTYYASAGISTLLYAMETDDSDNNRTVRRMLRTAFEQLRISWQRSTEGGLALVLMAVTVSELGIRKRRRSRRNAEWRRAELWWNRAESVWGVAQVFRLHLRCLGNFRDRVLADIAQLEQRLALVSAPLQAEDLKGAHERAAHYREEKRRESDPLFGTPSPVASPLSASSSTTPVPLSPLRVSTNSAPAAAPAAPSSSSERDSPVSGATHGTMHGVFIRSDSKVLPFDAYLRPRQRSKSEKKSGTQLAQCNATVTIVALEEEREVLRRTQEEITFYTAKLASVPRVDAGIVKAFDLIDSALDRSVCTVLPTGNFATNTRQRRHYE